MDVTGGKKELPIFLSAMILITIISNSGQTDAELALSLDGITIEQGPCGSKPKDSGIEIKQQEASMAVWEGISEVEVGTKRKFLMACFRLQDTVLVRHAQGTIISPA